MIKITDELLDSQSQRAKENKRKRVNYNFHKNCNECIQRFLNAVEPNTYVRPHKHENPDKIEIFLILRGRVLVAEFDDEGIIINHTILSYEGGEKGVEFPPKCWHSLIALEENSVLYEIKEGPYKEEDDKIFASWAPDEGTKEAQKFIETILRTLHINV